jgi:hypothetical protein
MLKAQLSIPTPLEHQLDLGAMTPAQRAAHQLTNNAGWVEDYQVRPGHRLMGLVNVEKEDVYRELPRTIKYTSPWINSFTDGNGKEWSNVITHLALTSRPRIVNQEPFPSIAAALSLIPPSAGTNSLLSGSGPALPEGGIYFSLAGAVELTSAGKLRPSRPHAFASWAGATFAEGEKEEYAAKNTDRHDDKMPPKKEEGPDQKKDEGEHKDGEQLEHMADEADMDLVDIACDLMELYGVQLPEDTTEDNLLQNLLRALMAHMKGENNMSEPNPTKPPAAQGAGNPNTSQAPMIQEAPPIYMSLEQVQAITDPQQKILAQALFSLQGELQRQQKDSEALKKNAFEQALQKRAQRIKAVAARVGNPKYNDMLVAQAASATLSLAEDGKVMDSMSATLDLLEAGLKDLPGMLMSPASRLVEQPQPTDSTGEGGMSPEAHKRVMDEITKNTGLSAARQAG